ncbi:MAG: type II secretion system GspH family protein [Gammaproteobacteria bacterium]|nr:type II secretion system GspH family protein [Gammaproteobacteria bacterium]MBU1645907.1 type II secretion system GspH family protein [Gammaproteobacteria bacterium]MBU1971969.1 type II secretion system GspH family protein [Gammaproteobacteria bacterium]
MSTRRSAGFTMVEMVVAITITAIIGGMVAVFISRPIEGYVASVRRADLTDAADGALRRIARDVRTALPNSLRHEAGGSNQCFEFLPTVGGGRYRMAQTDLGAGDILNFAAADVSFDVLAGTNLPNFAAATHHAVIYNLGILGADAYNAANLNRAAIRNTATAANIVLTAGNQFPFESPGRRFHVIPDFSVIYSCAGGELRRSVRAITAAQLVGCPLPGVGDLLVSNVSACSFSYTPGVSARNGLLGMTLQLTLAGESVQIYQEVQVDNVP